MEIIGKIRRIGQIESPTQTFHKRRLVLEMAEGSGTVQVVEFELKNGNTEAIDGFSVGDTVRVHFNIKGREVLGREGRPVVYNSLDVYRIDPVENSTRRSKNMAYQQNDDREKITELWF